MVISAAGTAATKEAATAFQQLVVQKRHKSSVAGPDSFPGNGSIPQIESQVFLMMTGLRLCVHSDASTESMVHLHCSPVEGHLEVRLRQLGC